MAPRGEKGPHWFALEQEFKFLGLGSCQGATLLTGSDGPPRCLHELVVLAAYWWQLLLPACKGACSTPCRKPARHGVFRWKKTSKTPKRTWARSPGLVQNIARHRSHYSLVATLGPSAVTAVADVLGIGIYFNTLVPWANHVGAPRAAARTQ